MSASVLKIWVGRWAYESPICLGILQAVSAKSRWIRSHHPDSLGDGRRWVDFQCRGLGYIGAELRVELGHIVGEEGGLVAGAVDGDVAEAGVEQVRVDAGVCIHKHALGGEALGAVAGNGVTVVEMAVLLGLELDLAVAVEAG